MNLFQWLGVAFCALLIGVALRGGQRRRFTGRVTLAWVGVWLIAAIAILLPDLTTRMARVMGIGRGADLVLYLGLLLSLSGFLLTYTRLRRLEADLTELVRRIALRDADETAGGS